MASGFGLRGGGGLGVFGFQVSRQGLQPEPPRDAERSPNHEIPRYTPHMMGAQFNDKYSSS